jgi:alkylation response protein AidB-like acyl-CoA dehydrogenase
VAARLTEKVFVQKRGSPSDRTRLAVEIEGANAAMEGLASRVATRRAAGGSAVESPVTSATGGRATNLLADGTPDSRLLANALLVRYSIQQAIERTTSLAIELLGGLNFMSSAQMSYLSSAAHALAFHPPSRTNMSEAIAEYLGGEPFRFASPPLQRAA